MNSILKSFLVTLSALSLISCGEYKDTKVLEKKAQSDAKDENMVLIATAAPLTGTIAHLGKDHESGARLAIEHINETPPEIDGRIVRFRLVSEDDQADPKIASQLATQFVAQGVSAIVGHLNSGTTIPVAKIYAEAGIPQISGASTHPAFTQQGFSTAFRLVTNDAMQGKVLAEFAAHALHAKTVAVIDDRSAYGQGIADEFLHHAQKLNIQLVKREFTSDRATDFIAILTAIKAAKPDLIFFGGFDAQAAPMAKQMEKLNLNAKFLGADGMFSPEFIKVAGDAAEGSYASFIGLPRNKMPKFEQFQTKFREKYGEVQLFSPYTYDAVHVIVDAMKRADSTDPKVFAAKLATTDFEGVTGQIQFNSNGDLKNPSISIYQVKQGTWQPLQFVSTPN